MRMYPWIHVNVKAKVWKILLFVTQYYQLKVGLHRNIGLNMFFYFNLILLVTINGNA